MAKVSVIVPVYNGERHLEKCMDSICSQTLEDIEIICVDDGSTDGTPHILRKYATGDGRVRILTQKNLYAGTARNRGMEHAEGKYLSFLDADDYFEPHMLEKLYHTAEERGLDIAVCRHSIYDEALEKTVEPGWSWQESFLPEKEVFRGTDLKNAGVFQAMRGWAWDKLFRTDFVRRSGYVFPEFRSSEDGFFVYMLAVSAERISCLGDSLVTHRLNQKHSLSAEKEGDWLNGFRMWKMVREEMEYLEIYDTYRQSYLNEIIDYLAWYLDSFRTYEAFRKCFYYIRNVMEEELQILCHGREYYFKSEAFDWYRKVTSLSAGEYLFRGRLEKDGRILECKKSLDLARTREREKDWVFPFHMLEAGKTVVLYGAGKIGQSFYRQMTESGFCRNVIWVDRRHGECGDQEMQVRNPDIMDTENFDYVFIAVKDGEAQKEIRKSLLAKGIASERIRCFGQAGDQGQTT